MFFFGSTVRIFDNYTDYTFLKNVYFIKPNEHFINTIENDTLYSIAFYYSYLIFCFSFLFHIFFMYIVSLNIYNPIQYWEKFLPIYILTFLSSFHFYYLFYIFNSDIGAETYLNLEFLFSILTVPSFALIMKNHNLLLKIINDNNPSIVLNYVSEYLV